MAHACPSCAAERYCCSAADASNSMAAGAGAAKETEVSPSCFSPETRTPLPAGFGSSPGLRSHSGNASCSGGREQPAKTTARISTLATFLNVSAKLSKNPFENNAAADADRPTKSV